MVAKSSAVEGRSQTENREKNRICLFGVLCLIRVLAALAMYQLSLHSLIRGGGGDHGGIASSECVHARFPADKQAAKEGSSRPASPLPPAPLVAAATHEQEAASPSEKMVAALNSDGAPAIKKEISAIEGNEQQELKTLKARLHTLDKVCNP